LGVVWKNRFFREYFAESAKQLDYLRKSDKIEKRVKIWQN